jgi:CTD small phosphatase-like protein 2
MILDSKKYTILFDLDETLIHCTLDLRLPADKKLTIKMN